MTKDTIALCMIVKGTKDEAPLLAKALGSINGYVDAIYLNINVPKGKKISQDVIDVAERFGAIYIKSVWEGNFVKARTQSFSMATEDFLLWLDADDIIDRPQEIKNAVSVLSKQQQGIYILYDYDHDEYGNTTVSHWVARIVRNNGSYKWQASISDDTVAVHETLVEVIPRPKALCGDFKVVHQSTPDRMESSLRRNIELLEGMYGKQGQDGEYDPRTLFYLATHYYDAKQFGQALNLLQNYLQLSGWAEERCEARVYVGNIFRRFEQDSQAATEYLMAIGEYQNSPRPYIELAEIEYEKSRYQQSADWIEKCLQLPKATTTMVQRPMESTFRAYLLGAQANVNIGGKKLEVAHEYIQKALKLRPTDPDAKKAQDIIDELIEKREDIRAAMRIVRKYEKAEQATKIVPFINSLPDDVQDNPLVLNTRHQYTEPKMWGEKTIAVYVGQGPLGIWGPWSLDGGIGGSEEAVIRLSNELAKLGWKVTVYATPGEKFGYYNNANKRSGNGAINWDDNVGTKTVLWKQYYEFNPKDEYNVLIAWRNPAFFDAGIKAKKRYLWLHDVMDKEEFIPERLENIDKVIFVGQYHADLYKGVVPEEKWLVSGNGIEVADFIAADGKYKRTPHRMIYMSSYNRGLKILLDNWNKIRTEAPDATLDIYYGWEGYDAINKDNPERMEWKNKLVKQMKSLPGVKDHGRVSHKQIVKEIATADIFAYPCIFNEVYAISYVKAMAGGAWPVSTDFAELQHYKKDGGIQVHYEMGKADKMISKYIDTLTKTLKEGVSETKREAMMEKARSKYGWYTTAEQWNKDMS